MKCVFVFVSCLLAAASAGFAAPSYAYNAPVHHGHAYAHAGHYNSVAAAGAPYPVQDTHEVAAAKAEHFRAHAAARAQAASAAAHAAPAAPIDHGSYFGSHSVAVGAPHPVQDTHEVAAAKAEHFRAHAAVRSQGAHASPYTNGFSSSVSHEYTHHAPASHGYSHAAPVSHGYAHAAPVHHGYAHAAPVSHGYAHAAPVAHGFAHGGHYGGEARLVDPVAIAAGAPLPVGDTYEVAAAKAAHLKAHAAAKNGHLGLY